MKGLISLIVFLSVLCAGENLGEKQGNSKDSVLLSGLDSHMVLAPRVAKEVGFKTYEREFENLVDVKQKVILLYDKGTWLEGLQVLPNSDVVVSDVKKNEVLSFKCAQCAFDVLLDSQGTESSTLATEKSPTQISKLATMNVLLKPSDFQNGHALNKRGYLLAASHGKRAIEILGSKGEWEILVDRYDEKRFNSPNDLIVDSAGDVWFSDPKFGLLNPLEGNGGNAELEGEYLYRYSPKTQFLTRLVAPLLHSPNGLALSPEERILYVADSQRAYDFKDLNLASQILAFDVGSDKSLKNGRVFAVIDEGIPDGIKVDKKGNVWASNGRGIIVFAPSGRKLGEIFFPDVVSNLTFSLNDEQIRALKVAGVNIESKDLKAPLLYVSSGSKIYILKLKVQSGIKR